jgi:MFS family permease
MHVRYPIWLRRAERPGARVFAFMFALESITRASLATVIPLQAYALLQDARDVSLAFTAVGVTGLAASFSIPLLIRRIRRRWVYTIGALLLAAAPALIATSTLTGQVAGMLLRVFAVACLNITLSLYIMDYIAKRDLVHSEPLKLFFSAAAWCIGPTLGVYLHDRIGHGAAEAFSAVCALAVLGNFWLLRLQDNPAVAAATKPPPNPLASIGRFLVQPRLRLAWAISFGRSAWWSMFFVYAPLYMVHSGESSLAGALLVSAANFMLVLTPLWGRFAVAQGLRLAIVVAFLTVGAATLAAGTLATYAYVAGICLLLAAVACVGLDAVGNIPFFRAVHPYERPPMTTVFRTYVDAAELVPSAVFAVLLSFFDLPVVFLTAGLSTLAFGLLALYLPRGM